MPPSLHRRNGGNYFRRDFSSVRQIRLLRVVDGVADLIDLLFHLFLKFVDTPDGDDVADTDQDDTNADERGKRDGGHIRVAETQHTEDGTGETQQEDDPPVLETVFLVVKAVDNDNNTFDQHPHGKDDRERNGDEQVVRQEDDTEDDEQESREHPAAAVGQEFLRTEGEDHLGDTGNQCEATDHPSSSEERRRGLAKAKHAEDHEENTCNDQPDFSTFVHRFNSYSK